MLASEKKIQERGWRAGESKKAVQKATKSQRASRYAIAAKRSMMRGQLGRLPPLSEAAATVRSRGPTGRASIRAADDVLEADLQSDEILACFEEALGERQPEMGTDAAAGREANAESAEAAPRLEAAAEQQREHSLLAPTAGRGVEPVLPDPVPMLHTNSGGGRRSCEPDAGEILPLTEPDGPSVAPVGRKSVGHRGQIFGFGRVITAVMRLLCWLS